MAIKRNKTAEQPQLLAPEQQAPNDPISQIGSAHLYRGDALDHYVHWPRPTVIVSDGAYGVGGFPGDPPTETGLPAWYAQHVAAWSQYALPETTLWFWGTEIGWATVHPVMVLHGWKYAEAHVWSKGVAHVAGNVNSKTIRSFPVVTELCVRYVRDVRLPTEDGQQLPLQQWLRAEWLRSGLPLSRTNIACGVKNAATRKYFTQDHLWYFPPPEMMVRLASYANEYGRPTTWPYFSLDGYSHITTAEWERMRAKWKHIHGVTNVWSEPAVRGEERLKDERAKCIHGNQKPLRLLERILQVSSDTGDVVWEPFGGLCSVAVASLHLGRECHSSEQLPEYFELAQTRLHREEVMIGRQHTA